jgi:glutamate synthase (ferredoxin)
MTGGTVVVLGTTGRNFAAGMSGGVAYVYDEDGKFATRCNTSMVSMDKVHLTADQHTHDVSDWHDADSDEQHLKRLLQDHNRWTGSKRARELLDNWTEARLKFVKVFPNEYKRALLERKERRLEASTETTRTQAATRPSSHQVVAAK